MASINISIKDEAYRFLQALKSQDESFSDVILRFKEKKGSKENIMKFFGGLKKIEINWAEKENRHSKFREEFDSR